MRSKIIVAVCLLFVGSGVFAQQAVIRELTGTVELKQAGSAVWEKAVQGQSIAGNTVISTGFKSYAQLNIGNSILNVRPLTRLSLAELSSAAGIETIRVNLQAGRVRANVNPPAGSRSEFSIQTPPATASVRGTTFEVDVFTLSVIEGSVEYTGTSGVPVLVDTGSSSYVDDRTGRAASSMETLFAALNPEQPVGSVQFSSFKGAATVQRKSNMGVPVVIDYE